MQCCPCFSLTLAERQSSLSTQQGNMYIHHLFLTTTFHLTELCFSFSTVANKCQNFSILNQTYLLHYLCSNLGFSGGIQIIKMTWKNFSQTLTVQAIQHHQPPSPPVQHHFQQMMSKSTSHSQFLSTCSRIEPLEISATSFFMSRCPCNQQCQSSDRKPFNSY